MTRETTEAPPAPGASRQDGRHGRRAVAVVLVGAFMALLDTTIVNVALPSIRTALHASPAGLEWIVSGYALAYGLVLVPAGRVGDRIGHKRQFIAGLALFTLASVACGISRTTGEIIAARVVQGVGAGVYYPAISATIQLTFTGPRRSKAFGTLGAVIGASAALGPLLGGLIIQAAGAADGWRWVFLVNLLVGAIALPLAARLLPAPVARMRRGIDPVGLALFTAGLLLLLIPLIEGQQNGWPGWTYGCIGASVVALALLAVWEVRTERRGGDALLKPALLARASFAAGAALAIVFFAGFTSAFFALSILWQVGLGHSALASGLVVMPFAFGSLAGAAAGARLSARLGRTVLLIGCVLVCAGLVGTAGVLHLAAPHPGGWQLVGPLLAAGLGSGMVIAPNQDFVMAHVPREEAGTAGGTLTTAQRVGSAIGIAVVGTVLFGTLDIRPGRDTLARAYGHSAQLAMLAGAGFVLVALLLVAALPQRAPARR
ncbi:MFS transporter [Streptomyces sp. NPDC001093]|uniref:MFS transporter n=1 Tax=Streptomyces sp. NPDC001093 TaxID=3154376 RepID=UPI00331B0756